MNISISLAREFGARLEELLARPVDLVALNPPTRFTKYIEKKGSIIYESWYIKRRNQHKESNLDEILWNSYDELLQLLASGGYFDHLRAEKFEKIQKMVLMRWLILEI